jgi:hypothetical protein
VADTDRHADRRHALSQDFRILTLVDQREYRDPGKLRRRLKQLVGTLTPVAEIIGGTAAFLEIINDLKCII